VASNFAKNPVPLSRNGACVGKALELVVPAIYAFPAVSTAIAAAESVPKPPKYVEYFSEAPSGLNSAKNPSEAGAAPR
jgi:hypothetical protein